MPLKLYKKLIPVEICMKVLSIKRAWPGKASQFVSGIAVRPNDYCDLSTKQLECQ